MAVSKLQDWTAVATTSTSPNQGGEVTIPSGTNRTLILVHSVEVGGDYTASCAVGGVSASGRGGLFWESGGASDLSVKYWYWDESRVALMSASASVSWTESVVLTKQAWSFATFGSVDQSAPVAAFTSVDTTVSSASPMTVETTGATGDYSVVWGHRDSQNRELATDQPYTRVYHVDTSDSKAALFDTAWTSSIGTFRGEDDISDVMILGSLVLKAFVGVTTVSGSGSPSGVIATIAGTGERIIVGNGSASVIAAIVSATAERIITATGSASGPNIVVYGNDSGGFIVAVPVQTTIVDDPIGKSVNVQGL